MGRLLKSNSDLRLTGDMLEFIMPAITMEESAVLT